MRSLIGILALSITCVAVEIVTKWGVLNTGTVVFDIGPKLCLWATSTLFALSLMDRKIVIAQIVKRLRAISGAMNSNRVIELINKTDPNPRFSDIFGVSLGAWVINVVVSSRNLLLYNAIGTWNSEIFLWFCVSLIIGVAAIIAAVCSAKEVTKIEQHYE